MVQQTDTSGFTPKWSGRGGTSTGAPSTLHRIGVEERDNDGTYRVAGSQVPGILRCRSYGTLGGTYNYGLPPTYGESLLPWYLDRATLAGADGALSTARGRLFLPIPPPSVRRGPSLRAAVRYRTIHRGASTGTPHSCPYTSGIIFRALLLPLLLYGCGATALRGGRIETAESGALRRAVVA